MITDTLPSERHNTTLLRAKFQGRNNNGYTTEYTKMIEELSGVISR